MYHLPVSNILSFVWTIKYLAITFNLARRLERSTDQVLRAVYRDSLEAWATNASLPGFSTNLPFGGPSVISSIPKRREVLYSAEALKLAPMLSILGYDRVFPGLVPGAIPELRHELLPDYTRLESPLLNV